MRKCRSPWQRRTKPRAAALEQQIPMALQRVARARDQRLRPIPREELGTLAKSLLVLLQVAAERSGRGRAVAQGRAGVRGEDGAHHLRQQRRRQLASIGHVVERLPLVEAAHVHDPLDRLAGAAELQALLAAGDRHGPEINRGGVGSIDRDLRLAGRLAPGERGEVHEGEAHGALDLVGVLAGQEDDRAMRVDADRRRAQPVRCRVGEEIQNLALVRDDMRPAGIVRS